MGGGPLCSFLLAGPISRCVISFSLVQFLKEIILMKKGTHILECGRRGKPKFCPFRLFAGWPYVDPSCFSSNPQKANGSFIMSASNNPGGPEYDWGVKFNYNSGQTAPELITDKIYGDTLSKNCFNMDNIDKILVCKHPFQNGERSLNLICKDREQGESWFLGLTVLLSASLHPRTLSSLRTGRLAQSCTISPIGHV